MGEEGSAVTLPDAPESDAMRRYLYLILLVVPALALPAQGGIFSKRAPATPDKRVPELLYIVKADPDESKRAAAAAELRDYDAKKFPDMMLVLLDVLQNDTKPSVRREAAISLGRLRPISAAAGQALQKAAAKDPSLRVRVQAWSSLKLYQLNGYNGRMREPALPKPGPALPKPEPATAKLQPAMPTPQPGTAKLQPARTTTKEPPLADSGPKVIDLGRGAGPALPVIVDDPPAAPRQSILAPVTKQPAAKQSAPAKISSPSAPAAPPPPSGDGPMLVPQTPSP
jgi:hypothetical protein